MFSLPLDSSDRNNSGWALGVDAFVFPLVPFYLLGVGCGSVSIVTRLQAEQPVFDSRQGRVFSLRHSVQTGSGARPASCPNGYRGGSSTGGKAAGPKADFSPPSNAEVKECVEPQLHSPYVFISWFLVKYMMRLHGMILS
jgi:hypothetical protein